jgi:hypothetical protein
MKTLTAAVFALVVVLSGCGGSDNSGAPQCAPGEVAISGSIDGQAISDRRSNVREYSLVNFGATGHVEVKFAGNDRLFIEFPGTLADGATSSARVEVNFASNGGVALSNCGATDFPSFITLNGTGSGGTFVLQRAKSLSACSGPEKSGTITGCFRSISQ